MTWSIGVTLAFIWSSGTRIGSPAKGRVSMVKNEQAQYDWRASITHYTDYVYDESPGARLFSAAFSFSFSYSATSSNFGGLVGRGGTEKYNSETITLLMSKTFQRVQYLFKRYMHS